MFKDAMFLEGPTNSFMNVESNGIAISSSSANIVVVNHFLLTSSTIIDARVSRLHATSSHTIFFVDWIVSWQSLEGTWCAWWPTWTQTLVTSALLCTTYNILVGHVQMHYNLKLQWLQALDVRCSSKLTTTRGLVDIPSQLVSFGWPWFETCRQQFFPHHKWATHYA